MYETLCLVLVCAIGVLTMSYEGYVTIMLAALGVMLMVLTLFIGTLAIMGWSGMKEEAAKAATAAANAKIKDLDIDRMLDLSSRMEDITGAWENIQNQLVTGVTKPVASH